MRQIIKTFLWLTLFSIAMGYLESSVVVYLRNIYYPAGFKFPLVPMREDLAICEFWREAATIIMLIGIGIIAGKTNLQRFTFFAYCFAIWDIFYYIFLWLLIKWPESLLTWDILFIIPIPWIGPVLAPVIVSLMMISFAIIVNYNIIKGYQAYLKKTEYLLMIAGCLIIILSFIWDYISYISSHSFSKNFTILAGKDSLFMGMFKYIPHKYNWYVFILGIFMIVLSLIQYVIRGIKLKKAKSDKDYFLTEDIATP